MMRRSIALCLALLVLLLAATPDLQPNGLPRATLVGRITGPLGRGPVAGRQVVAIEVTTGARYATKTHVSGGFTLLLPAGRYRLDVAVTWAERVVEAPEVLELEPGDFVRGADVVLGGAGLVDR
jgi:hypothetical protein